MLALQQKIVIAADIWGKVKTTLQMGMMGDGGLAWIGLFDIKTSLTWTISLYFIAAVTLWSGLGYFFKYKKLYINSMG